MIPLAEWKDLILADERELRIGGSITFGSGLEQRLTGSEIAAVVIDEGADGALVCGAVLSASCRVDLVNDEGQWNPGGSLLGHQQLIGATLQLKLGAMDGEDTRWQDLGVFQVESAVGLESEALVRISCADSIASELYAPFRDEISYPAALAQIWSAAVGQTRFVWSGTVPNGSATIDAKPDWQNASLRTVLGMVAAAAGCFVRIDRQGSLQLAAVNSGADYTLSAQDYLHLERDDAFYGPVDALRVTPVGEDAAEKLYYANGGDSALHSITVQNNPLFQKDAAHLDELASGMLGQIAGFYSEKAEFVWRGDPQLRIGDRILLTDVSGRGFAGVLSRQSLQFDRKFQASCSCLLPEAMDYGVRRAITPEGGLNAAALTGAIDGALISAGSVTTNKLAAGSVTAEKIAAGVIETEALEAVTAKIGSLTAADIATDRLAAALAAFTVVTAGTANFDQATVAHLVAQALNLEFGTADEVFIKNLRVAYAQMVSAAIGNLVIQASDGNYYRIDVDLSGNVTAVPVTLTEDEIASGETAGGQVILATSITADSLNTSSLLATYALINKIDAARIDVDQLFAREAFVAKLITTDISSNSFIQQSIISAAAGEVSQFTRLDAKGLHIGEKGAAEELLLDKGSVNTVIGGQVYSRLAADYVQFGNYQLRRTADGGMAFKLKEG